MGRMTIVSILNDGWATIKENPKQFIDNIEAGMENYYDGKHVHMYPVGNYANPMEVHTAFHDSQMQIVAVGHNHMENVVDINESRTDDFYLAYKLDMARKVELAAKKAMEKVVYSLAKAIASDIKAAGKTVDNILEVAKTYNAFNLMSDEEKASVIWKTGCLLKE